MSDVGSARRAKDKLKATIGSEPWCAGVGVEREDGIGFVVRLTVRAGQAGAAREHVPERFDGVFVKIIEAD